MQPIITRRLLLLLVRRSLFNNMLLLVRCSLSNKIKEVPNPVSSLLL